MLDEDTINRIGGKYNSPDEQCALKFTARRSYLF